MLATFPGSADYGSASASTTFTINQATPVVNVTDGGGTYNGSVFPATATVAGVVVGTDDTPAATLEGVGLSYSYYAGTSATGTPLWGAPSQAGTYTVVASFAGSTDYGSVISQALSFTISTSAISITPIADQQNTEGDSVSLQVDASDLNSNSTLSFGAVGLPSGLGINSSTGLISGTIAWGAANQSIVTPTITVTDGTFSNCTYFDWNLTSAISITPIADQQNTEGDSVSLQVDASDLNSGGTFSFGAVGLPSGLGINSSTGLISGTIVWGAANQGAATPIITVSDGTSTKSITFNWNLVSAVSITPIADQQNTEGDSISLQVNATDLNSGSTLVYSATDLPNGLGINSLTGLISGTIAWGAANQGAVTPTITVTDGTSTSNVYFNWNLTSAISITPIADQQNTEGDSVSLQVDASDLNSGGTLSFSSDDLPNGLNIDPTTGSITGTIAWGAANQGAVTTTITVSDGTSSNSICFNWNLTSAIGITSVPNQQNTEGDSVSLQVDASDLNSGGTLSFSAADLPSGLTINPTTGLISGTIAFGAANAEPYLSTVTVTDGVSTNTQDFGWTVTPNDSITAIADQVNTEGDTVSLQVSASDQNNLAINYTAAGLPPGLSINASTGLISGTISQLLPDSSQSTSYGVTVTAVDTNGSTTSSTFNWTIQSPSSTGQGLIVKGQAITVNAGDVFSGTVATFTNLTSAGVAGDYNVNIHWGDTDANGVPYITAGTITQQADGSYEVTGQHTYLQAGQYKITVSVSTSSFGGWQGTASFLAMAGAPTVPPVGPYIKYNADVVRVGNAAASRLVRDLIGNGINTFENLDTTTGPAGGRPVQGAFIMPGNIIANSNLVNGKELTKQTDAGIAALTAAGWTGVSTTTKAVVTYYVADPTTGKTNVNIFFYVYVTGTPPAGIGATTTRIFIPPLASFSTVIPALASPDLKQVPAPDWTSPNLDQFDPAKP